MTHDAGVMGRSVRKNALPLHSVLQRLLRRSVLEHSQHKRRHRVNLEKGTQILDRVKIDGLFKMLGLGEETARGLLGDAHKVWREAG